MFFNYMLIDCLQQCCGVNVFDKMESISKICIGSNHQKLLESHDISQTLNFSE